MATVVAMCAAATDRFYIEDFAIMPGETLTVSILLDNEIEYTAFQCDLQIPEGLTASNFALTDRKHSSHTFTATAQPNGDIRLLCYSLKIKPFTGNSGALVTFDVTAGEDLFEPVTIELNNILFTTTTGTEIPFNQEMCLVTIDEGSLKGDVNNDGFVTISDVTSLIDYLLGSEPALFNADNADLNGDGDITIADVTALIDMLLMGN